MKILVRHRLTFVLSLALLVVVALAASALTPGDGTPAAAADGIDPEAVVTWEDHESAISNYRECVESNGLTIKEVFPGEGLRPTLMRVSASDSDGVPDKASADAAQSVVAQCRAQHLDAASSAWYSQHEPTAADLIALYDGLEACIDRGGMPPSGPIAVNIFVGYELEPYPLVLSNADHVAFKHCAWAAWADTGFLPPNPVWAAD